MPWHEAYTRYVERRFVRKLVFVAMGIVSVMTNYGTQQMLLVSDVSLGLAAFVGYLVGGQTNFFLHHTVTWRDRHPTMQGWVRRWWLFMAGNIVGAGIFSLALKVYSRTDMWPIAAFFGALGSSAIFNWLWNHHVSFAHHPLDPPEVDNNNQGGMP
ncbi:GtrA family protein [Candidatus Saccharibacteria bacterium]|nr:GtrA family protein [Candidatus Saccharibacteria bacterium]